MLMKLNSSEGRSRDLPSLCVRLSKTAALRSTGSVSGPGIITRRTFLRTIGCAAGGILFGGSGLLWYGTQLEPHRLQIERRKILLPGLPHPFSGLTVCHISDLHFGPYVGIREGRAVADVLMDLKPDIVVITGDHVSRLTEREIELVEDVYSAITAPLGAYAVLGNHDHWVDPPGLETLILRAGLTLLRNANVAIELAGERLYVAGVDDVWEKQDNLPLALNGVPRGGCAILLAHEPDFADEAAVDGRVALQLSGHSHGGQIRLPGMGALRLPNLGRKYPEGLFRIGEMQLYVNRGIGVVTPPVRVNCPPEVTVLELVSEYSTSIECL